MKKSAYYKLRIANSKDINIKIIVAIDQNFNNLGYFMKSILVLQMTVVQACKEHFIVFSLVMICTLVALSYWEKDRITFTVL